MSVWGAAWLGRRRLSFVFGVFAMMAGGLAAPARAATVVWAGGTGTWGTAGNWLSGAAPTSSDVAMFSGWAPLARTSWIASASTSNVGDLPSNAVDGLTTGRWSTGAGQTIGQSFTVDMGSAQTFVGVLVDAGTNTNDYPGGFDVYVSNDNISYGSVIASATGSSAIVSATFAPQTARYVKLVINTASNNAHWWSISELNVFGSTGGTQLVRSTWSASAAVTGGTNAASNALDGNTATYWTTGTGQTGTQWFKLDMQSARTFTSVTIDATGDANDYPHGYAIYAYNTDDGLHDGNAVALGAGTSAIVTVTFSSQTARYLKVVQTAAFPAQWWSVHEINVLNGASTLSRTGWVATASLNSATAASAIDGVIGTRWTTGTGQTSWQWFKIDLQSARTFTQLRLDDGTRNGEYPRTFAVYAYNTDDGLNDGNAILSTTSTADVIDLSFTAQTARYIKVLITADSGNNWSITEATVYGTTPSSSIQSSTTVAGLILASSATVTQGTGATFTVSGTYTQSAGAFVGGNSALAVQGSAFTMTGGTFTAGSGAATISGAASLSGAATFNGGSSSNLTFSSTLAIGNGTAATFNANTAAVTFTGAVTLQNGGAFNGNTGSGTFSAAPVLTNGTFTLADAGSSGRWTFTQSTTFSSGATLALPTAGGELSLSPAKTLTLNGHVTSNVGTASTLPKIDCNGCGAGQGITVAFGATATLNVNGLEIDNSVAAGVSIANGATYTLLKRLKLLNNVGGAGSTQLAITLGSATLSVPGCYFDTSAAHNVTLFGTSGSPAGARATFENQSTSANGPGSGPTLDQDGDSNGDNVGDNTGTAPYYGSVVEWTYASPADTSGTALGPPVAAYDWNTFAFYGVYAAFKDVGGGTNDRIWMRNTDGSAAYFYDVASTSGDIVGMPRYDSVNESSGFDVNGDGDTTDSDVHVVYIGTTTGHIIKLIDSGSSLALPGAASVWHTEFTSASVASVTSPLVSDGTNLYFGGTNATSLATIFGVQISSGANEKTLQKTVMPTGTGSITTAPAWAISGGSTYLFIGSKAVLSQAYVYRVQVSPGGTVLSSYTGATTNVNGLNLINNRLDFVTQGGGLYELDVSNFASGTFTTFTGFPYTGASAIGAPPFADPATNYAYFADAGGKLYVVTPTGAALTGYPYTIAGTPAITSTPYYKRSSGTIAVGAANGYAYFINRHDASNNPQIRKQYFVGAGSVTAISYNSNTSQYMAASSDGHMTYINASDVGADSDGVE
ncbi:MAG TPA: discoidin domain-containing protein [Polyangia bacterium]|nr:discoidin domain-containing protein [Polyangia bacterium]